MEKKEYVSEWSKEKVVEGHGYNNVEPINNSFITCKFLSFLNNLKPERIPLLDIGCGNGRIVLNFNTELKKSFDYHGLDCNKILVDIGNNDLSCNKESKFKLEYCNVDNLDSYENYKDRIFYLDSTFQMLANPEKSLELMIKSTDLIIFNRLRINNSLDKPEEGKFKWGGMDNYSPCWYFPEIFFENFNDDWSFYNFSNKLHVMFKKDNLEKYNKIGEKDNLEKYDLEKYTSEWERDEIVKPHNYNIVNHEPLVESFSTLFIKFLNVLPQEKIRILDIGCGRGTIAININSNMSKKI